MQETLLRSNRGSGGLRKDIEGRSREKTCHGRIKAFSIFLDRKAAYATKSSQRHLIKQIDCMTLHSKNTQRFFLNRHIVFFTCYCLCSFSQSGIQMAISERSTDNGIEIMKHRTVSTPYSSEVKQNGGVSDEQ